MTRAFKDEKSSSFVARETQRARFGWSIDTVAEPFAAAAVDHKRQQFIENVVIEPAAPEALPRRA